MKTLYTATSAIVAALLLAGCPEVEKSSDKVQAEQQERILKEGTASVGMPAIKNFREKRILKMIIELRDQDGLTTFTYTVAEQTGKPQFLCTSIGYAISDATGFTNPQRIHEKGANYGFAIMPQAEPNGLFTPESSEGSWVMCVNPETGKAQPVFSGARLIVSPFKLQ